MTVLEIVNLLVFVAISLAVTYVSEKIGRLRAKLVAVVLLAFLAGIMLGVSIMVETEAQGRVHSQELSR